MSVTYYIKKFAHNFVDNLKLIGEKLKKVKLKEASENKDLQNFGRGIQNLNDSLLGNQNYRGGGGFDENVSKFERNLTGSTYNINFDNETPPLRGIDTGTEHITSRGVAKRRLKPRNLSDYSDSDYVKIPKRRYVEEEVIYVKRRKKPKRVIIEEIDDSYFDDGMCSEDDLYEDRFESISGIPQSGLNSFGSNLFEENAPKKKKKTFDMLHGFEEE